MASFNYVTRLVSHINRVPIAYQTTYGFIRIILLRSPPFGNSRYRPSLSLQKQTRAKQPRERHLDLGLRSSLCNVGGLLFVAGTTEVSLLEDVIDIGATLLLRDVAEQDVHVFESAALSLLDQEEGEGAVGNTEDAEHQEDFVSNVGIGGRGELSNNKVEQPLC